MSISRRLFNIARAEAQDAKRRIIDKLSFKSISYNDDKVQEPRARPPKQPAQDPHQLQIDKYYAMLELPSGASWAEVKSAYRSLMRKYHPDRHRDSDEEQQVATELSQKLRVAYEALRKELQGT